MLESCRHCYAADNVADGTAQVVGQINSSLVRLWIINGILCQGVETVKDLVADPGLHGLANIAPELETKLVLVQKFTLPFP